MRRVKNKINCVFPVKESACASKMLFNIKLFEATENISRFKNQRVDPIVDQVTGILQLLPCK